MSRGLCSEKGLGSFQSKEGGGSLSTQKLSSNILFSNPISFRNAQTGAEKAKNGATTRDFQGSEGLHFGAHPLLPFPEK